MRRRRTTKHENNLKGDREGRPYIIGFFICRDRTMFCPYCIPACAGMTIKQRMFV